MKILNGRRVYVNNYDVQFFVERADIAPKPLIAELVHRNPYFVVPNQDPFAFYTFFEWPINTDWLMNQEWIEDYDLFQCFDEENVEIHLKNCRFRYDQTVLYYQGLESAEQYRSYELFMAILARAEHQINTLDLFLDMLSQDDEDQFVHLPAELEHRICH